MNCKKTEEQLSRYIDGQLKPEEREKVEEHLKRCSGCSASYEKLLALNKQAGEFRLGGNEIYWLKQKDSIIRRIKEAETAQIVPIAPRRTRHLVFQFAAIAASIVLITYISIHELRENEPIKSLFPTKTTTVQPTTQAIPSETVNKMKKEVSPQVETGINGEVPSAADKAMPKTIGETAYSRMALGDTAAGAAGGKIDESIGSMPTSVSMMAVEKEEKNRGKSPAAISKTDKDFFRGGKILSDSVPSANKPALWTEAPSAEKYPLGARLDEISPDQSDSNKIMVYMEWRRKAEYYQAKYSALISHTYTVDTLDDRRGLSADSLKMIVMEIAGIYYHIGLLSEEKAEKEAMLDSLKSMGTKVDSNSYRQIEGFISSLKSTFK